MSVQWRNGEGARHSNPYLNLSENSINWTRPNFNSQVKCTGCIAKYIALRMDTIGLGALQICIKPDKVVQCSCCDMWKYARGHEMIILQTNPPFRKSNTRQLQDWQ